jgi:type IV pilus secretin PilQ/predicted competence protein
MRPVRLTLWAATLVFGLFATFVPTRGEGSRAAAILDDVKVITAGDSVVVRLTTSRRAHYRVGTIDAPYRIVLDFDDTIYAWRRSPLVTGSGPLAQVRGSQFRKDVARVVLELKSRVPYAVREEGDSLLVALGTGRETATAPPARDAGPVVARSALVQTTPADAPPPRAPAAPTTPVAPPLPPAPAPAAPAAPSQLISLEFKDAEVVNLLRILAVESGRNIVIGDDVKGRMSISLHNVPWTLALQTILEARGLERLDRDGVIRIVSVDRLIKEREERAKIEESRVKAEVEIRTKKAEAELKEHEARQRQRAAEAAEAEAIARGPLTEAAIRMAYADPGEVANTLQGLLGIGEASATITPCRIISQEAGRRTTITENRTGGGASEAAIRGPIAEPPFSQLFGPPREGAPAREAPLPAEEVTGKRRAVRVHCATNTVFLRLHATDLERVRKLIRESLDIAAPQVKIEARMEILERDDLFAIGVQWGGGGVLAVDGNRNAIVGRGFTSDFSTNPPFGGIPAAGLPPLSNPNLGLGQVIPVSSQTGLPQGGNLINLPIGALLQGAAPAGVGGLALGIIGSRFNLNLALEALRTQGKTVTLARPDIVTLENTVARISLGEEIPYATVSSAGTQIQFKEALLQLSVYPTVIREGARNRIRMIVMVQNNSRGNVVNLGASGAPPAINRRSAETDIVINEGDHLVIGGIMTSVSTEETRRVPLFGDVPVLGWLFKQRGTQQTRRELAIFITPIVLKGDLSPEATPARPAAGPGPAR